jgi:hypothetical protein
MNKTHTVAVASLSGLLILSGCTPMRPTLYPNDHLQQVGSAQAQQDIADCEAQAEEWVKSGGQGAQLAKEGAKNVAVGTAVGAASGAVGGAIWGNPGSGAAAGAAGGATAGLLGTLFGWMFTKSEPEPVYRNFVEKCLRDKGYDPIGWQ